MLALTTMSADATAVVYVFAFIALTVAAFIAFLESERGARSGALWLCVGLALFVLVAAWNALAVT